MTQALYEDKKKNIENTDGSLYSRHDAICNDWYQGELCIHKVDNKIKNYLKIKVERGLGIVSAQKLKEIGDS